MLFELYEEESHVVFKVLGLKFKKKIDNKNVNINQVSGGEFIPILRNIERLNKIQTLVKDGVFQFDCKDMTIKISMPNVGLDFIQNEIIDNGNFFEHDNLKMAEKYIKKDFVILDAGANIGNHSLYFSKICKAKKVISFKPQNNLFETLNKNIEINNCSNIEAHKCALGSKIGYCTIDKFYTDCSGSTSFKEDEYGSYKLVTLDSLNIDQLDFCKVDVEGAQLEFLKGAKETHEKFKPTIWIEMLDQETIKDTDDNVANILPKKTFRRNGLCFC